MNFYPFHIGDYAVDSRNLSLMEDLAYRRLLDLYYSKEEPIPDDLDRVCRLVGMRDESEAVSYILSEFFLKSDGFYRNQRCDEEITKYQAKSERAKNANSSRWSKKKSKTLLKSDVKSEADQIPTKNQEPTPPYSPPLAVGEGDDRGTAAQQPAPREASKRGTRLPGDWTLPDDYLATALDIQPTWTPEHARNVADEFRDYWTSVPGAKGCKLDWLATWRNQCRKAGPLRQARGAAANSARPTPLPLIPHEEDHKELERLAREWGVSITRDMTYRTLRDALFDKRRELANAA